jgi:hypothetical protein
LRLINPVKALSRAVKGVVGRLITSNKPGGLLSVSGVISVALPTTTKTKNLGCAGAKKPLPIECGYPLVTGVITLHPVRDEWEFNTVNVSMFVATMRE